MAVLELKLLLVSLLFLRREWELYARSVPVNLDNSCVTSREMVLLQSLLKVLVSKAAAAQEDVERRIHSAYNSNTQLTARVLYISSSLLQGYLCSIGPDDTACLIENNKI